MITDFYIKQGDTLEPITVQLTYADGSVITRSLVGATAAFHMRDAQGTLLVNRAANIIDTTNKYVQYAWIVGDTAESSGVSPHQAEFQITYASGDIETFPNQSNINIHVFPQVA